MKKIFASVLAAVMVLSIASSAMAFSWGKPAETTSDAFANRYKIEIVKLANETGIIGTNRLIEAPGATAVNNASVYFYIRLTVSGATLTEADKDDIQKQATATVSFTALNSVPNTSGALREESGVNLTNLPNGVYYYNTNASSGASATEVFRPINEVSNSVFSNAAIEGRVLDTATAKVHAKVSAKRSLPGTFNYGSYDIEVTNGSVTFKKANSAIGTGEIVATFNRDGNGKVISVDTASNGQDVTALYQWLNAGSADAIYNAIRNGEMYMTNDNIRAAFGFNYKAESSITWNASSSAIILDPVVVVGIPKTGDNASVIGFALVMLAAIGAAVAVKKVRA